MNKVDSVPVGLVELVRKTKERPGYNGDRNRGLLIKSLLNNEERWLSIDADEDACNVSLGTKLYYRGQGQRPSLVVATPEPEPKPTPINNQTDDLLTKNCTQLAEAYALMCELLPSGTPPDVISKMAISASIATRQDSNNKL